MRCSALALAVVAAAVSGCGGHAAPTVVPPPPARTTTAKLPRPRVRYVHGPHREAVPILVYHVIGTSQAGNTLEGLYVPPAELRAQVDWLAHTGWHAVTIDQLLAYWRHGVALPRKPVVLSFDDGYPGDWRYALPILASRHFAGVLNLQIGNLVPSRVRELIRGGWEIASHTFTHPDLTTVHGARLRREVVASRMWIESVFHVPVHVFCYPFGRYDAAVVAEVRRAGYTAAETENAGWASPVDGLLKLDRIRIGPATSLAELAALLRPT